MKATAEKGTPAATILPKRCDLPGALLRLRRATGLTQEKAGEALGASKSQINRLERGKTRPTIDTLRRLAEYYSCPELIDRFQGECYIIGEGRMRPARGIGREIREARRAAGLSGTELCKRLGVPRKAVSEWERGGNWPAAGTLLAIDNVLGSDLHKRLGHLCPLKPLGKPGGRPAIKQIVARLQYSAAEEERNEAE